MLKRYPKKDDLLLKMMDFVLNNDGFCIKNDEFRKDGERGAQLYRADGWDHKADSGQLLYKTDDSSTENDDSSLENDEFWAAGDVETSSEAVEQHMYQL